MERNFKYLKGRKFYLSSRKKSIRDSYPKLIRVVSNIKNGEMAVYIEDYGNYEGDDDCRVMIMKESELFDYFTPLTPKGVATLQFCEDTTTKDKAIFLIFNKYIKEDYDQTDIKNSDIHIFCLNKQLDAILALQFGLEKVVRPDALSPLSIFESFQTMPINSIINTDRFVLKGSLPNIIYDPDEIVNVLYNDSVYLYYEDNYEYIKDLLEIHTIKATMSTEVPINAEATEFKTIQIPFSSIYNSLNSTFIDGNIATVLNCFPMVEVESYEEFIELYGNLLIGDYKDKDEATEIKYHSMINLLYILAYTPSGDPVLLSNTNLEDKLKYIELDKLGFKKYEYDHSSMIRNNDPKYKIVLVKFENDEVAILKIKVVKDLDQMKIGNSEEDTMSEEELSKFLMLS